MILLKLIVFTLFNTVFHDSAYCKSFPLIGGRLLIRRGGGVGTTPRKRIRKGLGKDVGCGGEGKDLSSKGLPVSPAAYLSQSSLLQIFVDGVAGDVEGFGGAGEVVFVLVVDTADMAADGGFEIVGDVLVWFLRQIFHHLFMFG